MIRGVGGRARLVAGPPVQVLLDDGTVLTPGLGVVLARPGTSGRMAGAIIAGADGDVVVEGPFAGNRLYLQMLSAATLSGTIPRDSAPRMLVHNVIAPNFGLLGARLEAAGARFLIPPTIRFKGEPGEQGTFFLNDPAGNALEFKCFERIEMMFAT